MLESSVGGDFPRSRLDSILAASAREIFAAFFFALAGVFLDFLLCSLVALFLINRFLAVDGDGFLDALPTVFFAVTFFLLAFFLLAFFLLAFFLGVETLAFSVRLTSPFFATFLADSFGADFFAAAFPRRGDPDVAERLVAIINLLVGVFHLF